MRVLRATLGYVAALAVPLGVMLVGTRVGMPAFVFEHLVILFVVGVAVVWGMRPAVVAALAAALGDDVLLRDPAGRPTMALAEAAVRSERHARAERDRLIAKVSHDLATPLAVVRGAVQLARLACWNAQATCATRSAQDPAVRSVPLSNTSAYVTPTVRCRR